MAALARPSLLPRGISPLPCRRVRWALNCDDNGKKAKARSLVMACASQSDASSWLLEAAKITMDENVRSGMVIGLGSGTASSLAIQYLGRRLKEGSLKNIVGIPMSVSSATEAAKVGIPLEQCKNDLQIDFAFDDADAIEEGSLAAVIGRRRVEGGESILQEKGIIKQAKHLMFITRERLYTKNLGGAIPVVIQSGNWIETAEEIDDLFLGDAEVWRRSALGPAGPMGGDFPLITKEGHHILDVIFTSPIHDVSQVVQSLEQINGVVDHGLVVGIPCRVVIALEDGVQVVDNFVVNMKEA